MPRPDPATLCPQQPCPVLTAAADLARTASPAKARQLRWIAAELHQHAAAHPDGHPDGHPAAYPDGAAHLISVGESCAAWLTGPGAAHYLTAAATGRYRTRSRPGDQTSSPASMRVRATVLRALARHLALPGPRPAPGSPPSLAPPPPGPDTRKLLAHLATDHTARGARTHAVAALAAAGIPISVQATLRLTDILEHPAAGEVRHVLLTDQPRPGSTRTVQVTTPLNAHTRDALTRWLRHRGTLAVSDRVPELFLTTHAAASHGQLRPAGLPVTARTLHRNHRAAITAWLELTNPHRDGHTDLLAVRDLTPGLLGR